VSPLRSLIRFSFSLPPKMWSASFLTGILHFSLFGLLRISKCRVSPLFFFLPDTSQRVTALSFPKLSPPRQWCPFLEDDPSLPPETIRTCRLGFFFRALHGKRDSVFSPSGAPLSLRKDPPLPSEERSKNLFLKGRKKVRRRKRYPLFLLL